jgi:hypothetical protein
MAVRFANPLRVVPVRVVEGRAFADGPVDEIGALRLVLRVDVRFHRDAQLRRRVGVLAEDSLTADDDDLVVVGDVRGSADDVLEIPPSHRAARVITRLRPDAPALLGRENARKRRRLSQRTRLFRVGDEKLAKGFKRAGEKALPGARVVRGLPGCFPALHLLSRTTEDAWIAPQSLGDDAMQSETPLLGETVGIHVTTIARLVTSLEGRPPGPRRSTRRATARTSSHDSKGDRQELDSIAGRGCKRDHGAVTVDRHGLRCAEDVGLAR